MSVPVGQSPACPSLPLGENEVTCKTPVRWVDHALRHTFGKEYVLLKRCQHPDEMLAGVETQSGLELVVMDCILSRGPCESVGGGSNAREAPVQLSLFDNVTDVVNLEIRDRDGKAFGNGSGDVDDHDGFYRAYIVVACSACGCFLLPQGVPFRIDWGSKHARANGHQLAATSAIGLLWKLLWKGIVCVTACKCC